jgi:hypothetical protein
MSFRFNWPTEWNEPFLKKLKEDLEQNINSQDLGVIYIVEKISVTTLEFGTIPPKLKLLKIHELSNTSACFSFAFQYNGDAKIGISTKIDLNEKTINPPKYAISFGRSFLDDKPRILPCVVTLSDFVIDGELKIFVFFNAEKMIKNEFEQKTRLAVFLSGNPVKSFTVKTNFDEIPMVQGIIQSRLESLINDATQDIITNGIKVELP